MTATSEVVRADEIHVGDTIRILELETSEMAGMGRPVEVTHAMTYTDDYQIGRVLLRCTSPGRLPNGNERDVRYRRPRADEPYQCWRAES